MSEREYDEKVRSVNRFVPFLEYMIGQLKDPQMKSRGAQLSKMESLYGMITDKNKKLKLETLCKCEEVIVKLYEKVKGKNAAFPNLAPSSSKKQTPDSPTDESTSVIDIYGSAGESLLKKTHAEKKTFSVYESARESLLKGQEKNKEASVSVYDSARESLLKVMGKSEPINVYDSARQSLNKPKTIDMFAEESVLKKPPISMEDLEVLKKDVASELKKTDEPKLDEQMSLSDLKSLRNKLCHDIEKEEAEEKVQLKNINTTVRNKPLLTKINPKPDRRKSINEEKDKNKTKTFIPSKIEIANKSSNDAIAKKVEARKETINDFASILSEIDKKYINEKHERRKSKDKSEESKKSEKKKKHKKSKRSTKDREVEAVTKDISLEVLKVLDMAKKSTKIDDKNEPKEKEVADNKETVETSPAKDENFQAALSKLHAVVKPLRDPRLQKKDEEGGDTSRLALKYNPRPKTETVVEAVQKEPPPKASPPIQRSNNIVCTPTLINQPTPVFNRPEPPRNQFQKQAPLLPTPEFFNPAFQPLSRDPRAYQANFPQYQIENMPVLNFQPPEVKPGIPTPESVWLNPPISKPAFVEVPSTPTYDDWSAGNRTPAPNFDSNDFSYCYNFNDNNQQPQQQPHPSFRRNEEFYRGGYNNFPRNRYQRDNRPKMTYKEYKEQKEREIRERERFQKDAQNDPKTEPETSKGTKRGEFKREGRSTERSTERKFDRSKSKNRDSDSKFDKVYSKTQEEEFASPLDSLYFTEKSKTGKGYGTQPYKIPKKTQPKEEVKVKEAPSEDKPTDEIKTKDEVDEDEVVPKRKKKAPKVIQDESEDEADSTETANQADNECDPEPTKEQKAEKIEEEVKVSSTVQDKKEEVAVSSESSILSKFFTNLMGSTNKSDKKTALLSLISTFSDSFSENQLEKITTILTEEKEEKVVETAPPVEVKEEAKVQNVVKKKPSKHKTELDLLHEDIREMFIRDGVVTATGKRMCRILKDNPENLEREENEDEPLKVTAERLAKRSEGEMKTLRVVLPKLAMEDDKKDEKKKGKPKKKGNGWQTRKACRKKKEDAVEEEPKEEFLGKRDYHDKDYYNAFPSAKLRCQLCDRIMPSIAKHYRSVHPLTDVFSSRLSPASADEVIKDAIERRDEYAGDASPQPTRDVGFDCRVCTFKSRPTDPYRIYDHVSLHTGEFRWNCAYCNEVASNQVALFNHVRAAHAAQAEQLKTADLVPADVSFCRRFYAHVCGECNYYQCDLRRVTKHTKKYHKDAPIYKFPMNLRYKKKGDEAADAAEEESPKTKKVAKRRKSVKEVADKTTPEDVTPDYLFQFEESPKRRTRSRAAAASPKPVDESVFTTKNDILLEEERKIEEERLQKMQDISSSLKARTSLEMVDKIKDKLTRDVDDKPVKTEPPDEPPPKIEVFDKTTRKMDLPQVTIAAPPAAPKENKRMNDVIEELQGRLSAPPSFEARALVVGPIRAVKTDTSVRYECLQPGCVYADGDQEAFASHCRLAHAWDENERLFGECRECGQKLDHHENDAIGTAALNHAVRVHADFAIRIGSIRISRNLFADEAEPPVLHIPEDRPVVAKTEAEENPWFKIADVVSLADADAEAEQFEAAEPERVEDVPPPPRDQMVILNYALAQSGEKDPAETKPARPSLKETLKSMIAQYLGEVGDRYAKYRSLDPSDKAHAQDLYKCPEPTCLYSTPNRNFFAIHEDAHRRDDATVRCAYCDEPHERAELANHYERAHNNCNFACALCPYRCHSVVKETMQVHQLISHPGECCVFRFVKKADVALKDLSLEPTESKSEIVLYKCCYYEFLFLDQFCNHLAVCKNVYFVCKYQEEGNVCWKNFMDKEAFLEHWCDHHGCHGYQCVYCDFGHFDLNAVLLHLILRHPSSPLEVYNKKTTPENFAPLGSNIKDQIKIKDFSFQRLLELVKAVTRELRDEGVVKVEKKTPTKAEAAQPLRLPKLVPLSTIAAKNQPLYVLVPTSSLIGKKDEPAIVEVADEPSDENLVPMPLLDEPADPPADPLSLEPAAPPPARKTGLVGSALYRCAWCDWSSDDAERFKEHVATSPQCVEDGHAANPSKPFRCAHCSRAVKHAFGLVDHLAIHGQFRFHCALCSEKFPNSAMTREHVIRKHNIKQVHVMPLIKEKNNPKLDDYIVKPRQSENVDVSEAAIESVKRTGEAKTTFLFSEIDEIPRKSILGYDVTCGHCKTFKNKVRTNIVRHLQLHQNDASVPDTAPVNPVPCLEKNEKMFDKMINLAGSSNHSGPKEGGAKEPKRAKYERYPQFVPSTRRFACCAVGCSYLCPEESNLRHHLEALHLSEYDFVCVHCKANIDDGDVDSIIKHLKLHDLHLYKCSACEYVHNLRHKVDAHIANAKHKKAEVETVRAMDSEPWEEVHHNPMPLSIGGGRAQLLAKPWKCGFCKYRVPTRDDVIAHLKAKHDVHYRYKCSLCMYTNEELGAFQAHILETHDVANYAAFIISAYTKDDDCKWDGAKENEAFDTTPIWQRDKPRLRHIRGILFDEEEAPAKAKRTETPPSIKRISRKRSLSVVDREPPAKVRAKEKTESPEKKAAKDEPNEDVILIDDDEPTAPKESITLFTEYGDVGLPTNDKYQCPKCDSYSTSSEKEMVHHLCREMRVYRYQCAKCEHKYVGLKQMLKHLVQQHKIFNVKSEIRELPDGALFERWVELLLDTQAAIVARLGFDVQRNANLVTHYLDEFDDEKIGKPADRSEWADLVETTKVEVIKPKAGAKRPLDDDDEQRIAKKSRTRRRCPTCDFLVSRANLMDEHLARTGHDLMRCCHCTEKGDMESLSAHNKECHPRGRFAPYRVKCTQCSTTLNTATAMKGHYTKFHPHSPTVSCVDLNDEPFVIDKYAVSSRESALKTYRCSECPYVSHHGNAGNITKHVRRFHEKPFACARCDGRFENEYAAKCHHAKEHPAAEPAIVDDYDAYKRGSAIICAIVQRAENELRDHDDASSKDAIRKRSPVAKKSTVHRPASLGFSFYGKRPDGDDLSAIRLNAPDGTTTCRQFLDRGAEMRLRLNDCSTLDCYEELESSRDGSEF